MNDIVLAKLITDNIDGKWAHIHTTHNLFVVFALHDETESKVSLSHEGKKLLERIQREYYALDEKRLSDIKEIVQKCFNELPMHVRFSGVIAALSKNTIYIITAGISYAVMRRGSKQGVVAAGQAGEIIAFSGKLEHDDILILETNAFAHHLSPARLQELLSDVSFMDIRDTLHPHIHTDPKGGEAAIIMQYKADMNSSDEPVINEVMANSHNTPEIEEKSREDTNRSTLETNEEEIVPQKPTSSFSWKKIMPISVIIAILILGVTLFGLIRMEQQKREREASVKVYESIETSARETYDEALALLTVNRALGIEKLQALTSSLENDKKKLDPASNEYKKIEEFIAEITSHINESNIGEKLTNGETVFDEKEFDDISKIGAVSAKGGKLLVLDQPTGNVVAEGKVYKSGIKDASFVSFNSDKIFISSTNEIGYIATRTNKSTKQAESSPRILGMDSFLGNVYVATEKNTIDKYEADADSPKAYFTEDVSLNGITSISIDGSIWLTTKDGAVHKFTRGKKDAFTLGKAPTIGKDLTIYTDDSYVYVYILDHTNKSLLVYKKSGEYVNTFSYETSGTVKSFAVSEASGTKPTLYIATDTKVISYELPL